MDIYAIFNKYNIVLHQSKYADLYHRLISTEDSVGYTERHHVVPKSLGGADTKENIVKISARKHFLAHYLLCKMLPQGSSHWHKMVKAFSMMKADNKNRGRYFNSRLYEYARNHISKVMSTLHSGELHSHYNTIWMNFPGLNISKPIRKENMIHYIDQGWVLGRYKQSGKVSKARIDSIVFGKRLAHLSTDEQYWERKHKLSVSLSKYFNFELRNQSTLEMLIRSKQTINDMYWNDCLSPNEIADQLKIEHSNFAVFMASLDIPMRTPSRNMTGNPKTKIACHVCGKEISNNQISYHLKSKSCRDTKSPDLQLILP